jgi:undecaprenyl-diphosphatase
MIQADEKVFFWINSLVGKSALLDRIMILFANDYFIPVSLALILLGLWFWSGDIVQRENYHRAIIVAAVSMGSACGFTMAVNHLWVRNHPFQDMPQLLDTVNRILYPTHYPTFPSMTSAMTFATATSIWQRSHKIGWLLFIPAILMPFARIYAAIHWPLDVLAGAVLGILTSYFIAKIALPLLNPFVNLFFIVARKLCLA